MPWLSANSAFSCVTGLAAQRPVHAAFAWFHKNPKTIMDWQVDLVAIPAPPFGEAARSVWLESRFAEAGLENVRKDALGNVFGSIPSRQIHPDSTGPVVILSAHLDTVFPAETPLNPAVDGDRLQAPGACDNGAGVVGMLAIARALVHRPSQLLLDEPSNALDLAAQRDLRESLRNLMHQGTGLILVTHHLNDIPPEIERVILMSQGRIVADGPREQLLTAPVLSDLFQTQVRIGQHDGWLHSW